MNPKPPDRAPDRLAARSRLAVSAGLVLFVAVALAGLRSRKPPAKPGPEAAVLPVRSAAGSSSASVRAPALAPSPTSDDLARYLTGSKPIPFDCKSVAPAPADCTPQDPGFTDLVRAAGWISPNAIPCAGGAGRGPRWLEHVRAALARAERSDASVLGVRARVVAQNAALRIAECGPVGLGADEGAELERRAFGLVRKLALPSASLASVEENEPVDLHGWLGGRTLLARVTPSSPSLHERAFGYTRFIQPVAAGDRASLISRAIAVDTDFHLHLTSVVDFLAVRTRRAPLGVCIATFDLSRAACGAQAELTPLASEMVTEAGYHAPGLPCSGCHVAPQTLYSTELVVENREQWDRSHRQAVLDALEKQIAALRERNSVP